ncbi:MAG TPA: T9SS type A sorting domain-containing protein [Bacteroidia bacterium]|nr:T9SS type A sorting domain-containing protein [Bacteroidia bacterium]
MKKINKILLAIAAFVFLSVQGKATKHMIMTEDFFFSPTDLSVVVGDTIQWMWGSGNHTTTSTSVPSGAATWDQLINNASMTFDYVVLVPGTYQYQCTFHISMGMVGEFTASNPTGIPGQVVLPYLNIDRNLTSNEIKLNYNFEEMQTLTLNVFDLIGKEVKSIYLGTVPAGENEKTISLEGIAKGVYLVKLDGSDISITRKIVLQ